MTDWHADFSPERVDEQIEQLTQAPLGLSQPDTMSQRLLRHLQGYYAPERSAQDTQSLDRAWERITRTSAYQTQLALHSPASLDAPEQPSHQVKLDEDTRKAGLRDLLRFQAVQLPPLSPPAPSLPVKGRAGYRHLPILAATFLLVVLVGSLILGLIAHPRGQPGTARPLIPPVSIYAGEGFSLIKLDARTGKRLWTHTIPVSVDAIPVVANGLIYLASHAQIYALDTRDASVRWHVLLPESDSQPTIPVVVGKILYLGGSYAGTVYALDALNGKPLWHSHFPDQSDGQFTISDLTVVNGMVYGSEVHSAHQETISSFFALNALTGKLLWRIPAEQGEFFATDWFSAPVVSEGVVYVVSDDVQNGYTSSRSWADAISAVTAFNAQTGKVLWRTPPLEGGVDVPPVVVDGVVYLTTTRIVSIAANGQILQEAGTLSALRASDGSLLWHYQASALLVISRQLLGGLLYLGTNPPSGNGTVVALDSHTGSERWRWEAPSYVADQLIVLGGVLLVGAAGSLYALDATTGAPIWQASSIIPIGSSLALLTVAP